MLRINIPSDDVKSAGYDTKRMMLEIELSPEGIIQFFKVPEKVYAGLLNAKSYRSYYINKIKYIYRYERIEG
ncbi:MAG: KTSC domain-containing protein [Anaerolineaceae bacterium]